MERKSRWRLRFWFSFPYIGVQQYFKGEYLNGKKWNGKAKEYRDIHLGSGVANFITIVTFEGEYINGKKKGKGEKYEYK